MARYVAVLALLVLSCQRSAMGPATVAQPIAPIPLTGVWEVELRRGSTTPLYERAPLVTQRPPWIAGRLTLPSTDAPDAATPPADTLHGVAMFVVRPSPSEPASDLPAYPAKAVLRGGDVVWIQIDMSGRCADASCRRLLEFEGRLEGNRLVGRWKTRAGQFTTSGPGMFYRPR